MKRRISLSMVVLGASVSACDFESAQPLRGEIASSASSLASCTIEPAWAQSGDPTYTRQKLGVVPNGSMIFRSDDFGGQFFRTSDGTAITPGRSAAPLSIQDEWTKIVSTDDNNRVIVRDVSSSEILFQLEAPARPEAARGCFPVSQGHLAADGTLISVDCWQGSWGGGFPAEARIVAPSGRLIARVSLGAECTNHWEGQPFVVIAGDRAVVVGLREGAAASIDLNSGAVVTNTIAFEEPLSDRADSDLVGYNPGILSAAMSPDNRELILIGADGLMRRIDPRSLQQRSAAPAVVSQANLNTYLPSIESPIGFSPDGSVFARLDSQRRMELIEVQSGRRIATLAGPFDAPMAVSLERDAVTVSFEGGVARWRCADKVDPIAEGSLTVEIEAPATIPPNELITIRAHVSGSSDVVVRQLLIDDQPVSIASITAELTLYPGVEAGPHRLAVIASDGIRSGRAEMMVRF